MTRTKDVPCSGKCGRMLWSGSTSAASPVCRECRAVERGCLTPDIRQCKCDGCVNHKRRLAADFAAQYLAEHGEWPTTAHRRNNGRKYKPSIRKACGWCGIAHPLNDAGTTLNFEGLQHANWLRYYGKPSESREMVHVPRDPTKWASRFLTVVRPAKQWVFIVQGNCQWCGDSFATKTTSLYRPPRMCGARCTRREAFAIHCAKHGKFKISPLRRTKLHERDGWTCMICHEPTSLTYSHADPWSPTLDHIVPRSIVKDDSDDALRTAHALCNSIRSDDKKTDEDVRSTVLPMLYQGLGAFTPPLP